MLPRTSRFQSRPAVSAGHTSCWITERSGLPQKGTDRQVNDNTCEDKTIYSQRVVDTETYMGDGEWATGGGESARDECTPAARSAQIAQSTSCQHNKITGGSREGTLNRDSTPHLRDASWRPRRTHHGADGTGQWERGPECRELESSISPPDHTPPSLPGIDNLCPYA